MNDKELKILLEDCTETDLANLRNLLLSEGFRVDPVVNMDSNSMGIDIVGLSVFIPLATVAINGLVAVLKEWFKNREINCSIEDTKSGRKFTYSSKTGEKLSAETLQKLLDTIFGKE